MTCKKCGSAMYYSDVYEVRAYSCYMCGNVDYPDYPKRSAPNNVCNLCGEEFERKNMLQGLCETCRKLSGKNFNKAMRKFAKRTRGKVHPVSISKVIYPKAGPWNDRKLEAQLR